MVTKFDILPAEIPAGEIVVQDEEHRYEATTADDGSPAEVREYTLDKAPITAIIQVVGTADGNGVGFEQGVDYELSDDNERIVWLDNGTRPDTGTIFQVTYRTESIIGRVVESNVDEINSTEDALEQVIKTKFIDNASGSDLDEIGKLFGDLGKRRGRDDERYRTYLKSVVQSFVSRGTTSGIKTAVSAATGVSVDKIEVIEDFSDNTYEVSLPASEPTSVSLIEEIAEVADPSGVGQKRTRFQVGPDVLQADDTVTIRNGIQIGPDTLLADDSVANIAQSDVAWDSAEWNSADWAAENN